MSTAPPTAGPTTTLRKQATIIGLMFGLSVLSYFDRTILSIAGPGIMKEFSISAVRMGAVYSAFLVSYAVCMIPGGRMADRFGPRIVLTWMALGSAVFTALLALAATPGLGALVGVVPAFIMIRLAFGIFTAPLYPTCTRMNANWIPLKNRARATGVANSGSGFGGAVSPILFSWMIRRYGWRMSFLLAGIATGIIGVLWFVSVRDHPPGVPSPQEASRLRAPWRALLTDKNVVLLTLGFSALGYFEYIFFYWIYYYIGEIRHLSASKSAQYTTVLFLTWVVMMPLGGLLCDQLMSRFGRKPGIRITAVASLACSAGLLFAGVRTTETVAAISLMSLALGCASIADMTYWTAGIDVAGDQVGVVGGILNTGANVGGALAPVLTPWIASFAGWSWGLYAGCLVALAALVAWLFTDPTRRVAVPVSVR
jgi:ACS family glucarate transporter-like MFS transporter